MKTQGHLPHLPLPDELVADLRRQNPWWEEAPIARLPPFHRWPFEKLIRRLEKPLAPILVIRGPRQIGKTTLQNQLIDHLLSEGVAPTRILRVQFDELPALGDATVSREPILRVVDWFETTVLGRHLNAAAEAGEPAFLFLDEVQNLGKWDVQLKSLVDAADARVLVTGSSALRIGLGQDSLAGRIQTLEVGPLRLTEVAELRGFGRLEPLQRDNGWSEWTDPDFWRRLAKHARAQQPMLDAAFEAFSDRGGYPVMQANPEIDWGEVADQLNATIVQRVIQHDLRIGERGRKRDPQLLEEIFRMSCRYAGQTPNPATLATEARLQLGANIGVQRVRQYMQFLDSSLLIRLIQPLEIRLKKRKGHPKIALCDHALRAAWLQEIVSLTPPAGTEPHPLIGRIAESVAGYYLTSLTGLDVAHFPERGTEPEVDFILTIGEKRIPVEVKYRRQIDPERDTLGLRSFIEKAANRAIFGLLVTRDETAAIADPRIVAIPLKTLLMVR